MKSRILLLLTFPLLIFTCQKDIDTPPEQEQSDYQLTVLPVTASLSGQVIDKNRDPLSNVSVKLGNHTVLTNEAGFYQFRDITMNARGTYVTVSHPGYFHASDRYYPTGGSHSLNTIQLLAKTPVGTINAASGGEITLATGTSIQFPANSIANTDGQVYDGEVQIAAHWLNPLDPNLGDFMPGDLFGVNTEGEEVVMTSFGMLAAELSDEAGNEVNIAEGQHAILSFPVPAALLPKAPASLPLWYFDETDGIWIEEGSAVLEDGFYVGKVSHFSYWNVDLPADTEVIFISGCMQYDDGTSANNQSFYLKYGTDWLSIGHGYTGIAGEFSGPAPANEIIIFEMYDDCGQLAPIEIGPFTEDITIEDCLSIITSGLLNISGQLVDCDGQGVDGGIALLQGESAIDQSVIADENGYFSLMLSDCYTADVSLTGFDLTNLVISSPLTFPFTEDLDVGPVQVCTLPEEYVYYHLLGQVLPYLNPVLILDSILLDSNSQERTPIFTVGEWNEYPNGDISVFYLGMLNLNLGVYGSPISFSTGDSRVVGPIIPVGCFPCDDFTYEITANGGPGGFLEGSFNGMTGSLDISTSDIADDIPVSGTFRVKIPE